MKKLYNLIFGENQDFRVKLFNIMAVGGILISFFTVIQSILTFRWSTAIVGVMMMILSLSLLAYAIHSGKYEICYNITIVVIFFIFFPILFFQSGGYRSGVPPTFIFAVLFTVLMKKGSQAIWISIFELMEYCLICWIAYLRPDLINQYATEKDIVIDIIFGYSFVGLICGTVLYFHLKEFEHQRQLLKDQNKVLRHYDEMKSTFLTTVAHEIKNPLNIIGLYSQDTSELTEENPVDLNQIRENQKVIESTVMRLDQIVVDLMDTVSIEQGRLNLSLAPMDLSKLIRESVKFYQENEGNEKLNGNKIVLNFQSEIVPLMADYSRIFQVMLNLLSNAFRHTKNGTITVSLKRNKEGQIVSVKDTGEGMSQEILENAFKGYVSTSKDYWRHGIGLYICHEIIKAHEGKIWIESTKGVGTEISFFLPDKGV